MGASYTVSSFLGGQWSPDAQGRTTDPSYKAAMNVCVNGYPLEAGAWTRRQGFRYLGDTRRGSQAYLRAFDYTATKPYQLEFTNGYVRFWQGLGLVQEVDGTLNVASISTDTPAKVFLVQPIPATWNVGDTVIFDILSVPCSTTQLCNRQFRIGAIDATANYFTLLDGVTGANMNGATIAFVFSNSVDTVAKVFELVTSYGASDIANVRTVQANNQGDISVYAMDGAHKMQSITQAANPTPFAIGDAALLDGPYLTINQSATTLTLGGTSGSVSVTASGTAGINGGAGFLSTDVGRHLRFQSGPAAWSALTTYYNGELALGSDNNVYRSVIGGNLNHDPTTDPGTHWLISSEFAVWCWLLITAVTNTTTVTATIMDSTQVNDQNCLSATPISTTATKIWALGAFSGTTGYPTTGVFHKGRLWLANSLTNWLYGSFSNDPLCFTPTASDGTISDANGMSEEFNTADTENILWIASTQTGLVIGTASGEHVVEASNLNDPITPSSIDENVVSTYGVANIEPIVASVLVFAQRSKTRLLAHAPLSATHYFADNLNELADNIPVSGFAEIRWQQSPNLTIWARLNNGTLVGSSFQKMPLYSAYQSKNGSFTAWHTHVHGQGRLFTSISTGPAYNGLGDALYAVTNNTNNADSDYNVYHVEYLTPLFDETQPDWASFFVDGAATPCCGVQRAVANGDSFDGLQFYGLTNLVGQTVQPVLGALDLGDRVVGADGSVSVPYLSDPEAAFTLAFWQAFNGGTYGAQAATVSYTTQVSLPVPPVPVNTLNAYALASADPGYNGAVCCLDGINDKIYVVTGGNSTTTPPGSVRRFGGTSGAQDYNTTLATAVTGFYPLWLIGTTYAAYAIVLGSDGNPYSSKSAGNIGNDPTTDGVHWGAVGYSNNPSIIGQDGYIYCVFGAASNSSPIAQIIPGTGVIKAIFGVMSASLGPSSSVGLTTSFGMAHMHTPGTLFQPAANYLASVGIRSISAINEISILNTDTMTFLANLGQTNEGNAQICSGPNGSTNCMFIAIGHDYSLPSTGSIGIYTVSVPDAVGLFKTGTFAPADVDATWSHFSSVVGPAYDQSDGNILLRVATNDSVTNKAYWLKVNPYTAAIVWKLIDTTSGPYPAMFPQASIPAGRFCYLNGHTVHELNATAGTIAAFSENTGFGVTGGQQYDDYSASITFFGNWSYNTNPPTVIETGTFLTANPTSGYTSLWGRAYLGVGTPGRTAPSTIQYDVPLSCGFTYTSQGQLLRPDFGQDAGSPNGPAVGKIRHHHWYAGLFRRARKVSVGVDFGASLNPAGFKQADIQTPIAAPGLFSGVWTDTIQDDYGWDGMLAWQITRPYPCTIASMSGFVETTPK